MKYERTLELALDGNLAQQGTSQSTQEELLRQCEMQIKETGQERTQERTGEANYSKLARTAMPTRTRNPKYEHMHQLIEGMFHERAPW